MQTSKFLLVIGAAMIFSAPSLLAAKPETEAQIKMREALRLKMEELNAQETPPAPVVAPVAPEPAPVAKPEVKPATPKAVKVKAAPAKPKTVVVPVPVERPVVAPAKAEFSEPVTESEAAAAARMREALEKKMAELDATPAPVAKPQPKVVVAPEKPTPVKAPAKPVAPAVSAAPVVAVTPAPPKMEAPASPLPVTKQDRLAELLRRYKADELTAQDYHTQRAAIIAGQ